MRKILKVSELVKPKGTTTWQHEKCDICCLILENNLEVKRCKHLINDIVDQVDWTHLKINCSSKEGINCKNIMC